MRASSVTYQRVHNLGNYESERIEVTIQLDEGEKAEDAMRLARIFVNRQLGKVETANTELELFTSEITGA